MPKPAQRTFTTHQELKNLKPEVKTYWVRDAENSGLFVEISPHGGKTFQFRFTVNKHQDRIKIGQFPDLSLSEARNIRNEYALKVQKGINPKQEKIELQKQAEEEAKKNILFKDFAEKYKARWVIGKIKNQDTYITYIDKDICNLIGNKPIQSITNEDTDNIIQSKIKEGSPATASKLRALLKRMFDYAIDEEFISRSPIKKTALNEHIYTAPEQQELSIKEINEFYTALFKSNTATATKYGLLLSLLTLARKSEVINAKWKDIDFECKKWHIPNPKADNKGIVRPYDIYITQQVESILNELKKLSGNSEYIFPSKRQNMPISRTLFNTAIDTVTNGNNLRRFTVHNLRHTASTHLNDMGHDGNIVEALLNHKKLGIKGIYDKSKYIELRKQILIDWSNFIQSNVPILEFYI
ncbi:tyrosine-type recombinase/integrase [Acinetobacter gerneri]|uniref:tyrosine-type recombinase/integrase n=1 Tax=Acinetobacter gerneri TaxID=202952 RepID=UPI0028ACDE16|nr:tyrosine-type recombinase/integrase [Acinetobacter gerneri]